MTPLLLLVEHGGDDVKVAPCATETVDMEDDERHGWPSGPVVNQFGTPVNQFGTPNGQFGAGPQRGVSAERFAQAGGPGQHAGSFGAPAYAGAPAGPAAKKRRTPAQLALLIALICIAVSLAGKLVLRTYVFPDLSKPIELPGTVAGVSTTSAGAGQPVTVQSKDAEGRATAVSFYADDAAAPTTMLVVTAGRVKNLGTGEITETTRTIGKVTCTDNMATGDLLARAGTSGAGAAAAMRGMTTGAACWRTGRHLTVLVVAFTAHDAAQSTARQAVADAWDAV